MSTQPRVRLFVALEVPIEVREAVVAWAAGALSSRVGVRLLGQDHLHVTLCFLGWQPEDAVEKIAEACRNVGGAGRGGAGVLSVEDAVWLPPRRPRVLALRLAEEDGSHAAGGAGSGGDLVKLQARLSAALEDGGWYLPERRPYLPHVTVARIRGRTPMRPVAVAPPPSLSFPGSRITLFRSRLCPGGAQYEPLASVELE